MVLEYVKTLVWPLVVGGVLIGYRRSAFRLLGRLTQVDAVGVTATFDNAAEQAEELSASGSEVDRSSVASLADAVKITATAYTDARGIGEPFRDGKPVILDLTEISDEEAKRLVDFSAGLAFRDRGSMDKVANKVFMLTPSTM
jgi:FtsZ-interacting cell division protein YlmF